MAAYKRRFGNRSDGRRLRSITPISKISPYIMRNRIGSQIFIKDTLDIAKAQQYCRRKRREEGLANFGLLHVILAMYIRVLADYPQINRFVAGQKMYAHTRADVSMMVKRSMNIDAEETAVKVTFDQQSGPAEIYQKFNEVVMGEKGAPEPEKPKGGFDKTAFWFNLIPGFLLRFVFWVIRCLDYVGLLPKFLVGVSPFHASLFVTSMGSLGIPAIYHHLYDFGTVSIFLSYGAIRHEFVPDTDGTMKLKKYVDYVVTVDERICDGYYYAQVLKRMKELLENPELLDTPFEVQDDIK